ncbi:MAG: hypothetical protein ACI8WB_002214 [Phenylobacterium sp.]|jgi:hypothetical protein
MKSETCFGKASGEPLTEYYFEHDAQEAAEYSKEYYGNDLVPYHCDKCDKWHLSPKRRQTPSKKCDRCTAGDGHPKDSYNSKNDARTRADILFAENGINLKVYQCKYDNGWHLTKNQY